MTDSFIRFLNRVRVQLDFDFLLHYSPSASHRISTPPPSIGIGQSVRSINSQGSPPFPSFFFAGLGSKHSLQRTGGK